MKGWPLFLTILGVIGVHVALLSFIAFQPAKKVLPRADQPYIPPEEPKNNFAAGEFTYIDAATGERVHEKRFVVSTKLFTGADPVAIPVESGEE